MSELFSEAVCKLLLVVMCLV
uniref:Uncharacterized protein n=1 Tax=Anguilla anguilla TaxID=7936 RepID=A0A0E9RIF1_ANGAN